MRAERAAVSKHMKNWQRFVLGAFFTLLAANLVAWFWVLGKLCVEPAQFDAATAHIVAYNCHGRTVFITPLDNGLRQWLVPVQALLMVGYKLLRDRWQK